VGRLPTSAVGGGGATESHVTPYEREPRSVSVVGDVMTKA
jgi:hypothetical protein